MTQFLLVVAVALTVGAIVFGITVLVTGDDGGLRPVEPDGRAVPLPGERPLVESDLARLRFDTALRGYRMAQVDAALRRAGYDIGYKDELIRVLQAEVDALREGRFPEAEVLRRAREAALPPVDASQTDQSAPEFADQVAGDEPDDAAEPVEPAELTESAESVERDEPGGPAEPGESAGPAAGSGETDHTTLPSPR